MNEMKFSKLETANLHKKFGKILYNLITIIDIENRKITSMSF
jgi:hypothetical protein